MRYKLTFVVGLALGYVLGTRAGRERYEQLKKSARQVSQNPAVRNTAETAAQQGRQFAGKAYHAVSEKVGDHVPDSVTQRVRPCGTATPTAPQRTTGAPPIRRSTALRAPSDRYPPVGRRPRGARPIEFSPWG